MNESVIALRNVGAMLMVSLTMLGIGPGVVQAGEPDVQKLLEKVERLEKEVAELKTKTGDDYLQQRRAQEFEAIVRDVLEDADARTSMAGEGMIAGHNGKNFFLSNPDETFLMKIGGQMQFRYIVSDQDDRSDETEAGFQFRRMKLAVKGHVTANPKVEYGLVLAGDRDSGSVSIEDATLKFPLPGAESWKGKIKIGKFKIPFLREELNSSSKQLAVDRSSATEYMTADRADQVQIELSPSETVKILLSVNDGADSELTEFNADNVEIAFAGRVDVALQGSLKQIKDFTAKPGEETGVFVGGGFLWSIGDADNGDMVVDSDIGSSDGDSDYFAFTIDGSVETNGVNIFAAFTKGSIDPDSGVGPAFQDRDPSTLLVQGGFHLTDEFEPFVRWECIDADVSGEDEAYLLTVGFNWYVDGHNAKLTMDVVYFYDGDVPTSNPFGNSSFSSGLGLGGGTIDADMKTLKVLRIQWQQLY